MSTSHVSCPELNYVLRCRCVPCNGQTVTKNWCHRTASLVSTQNTRNTILLTYSAIYDLIIKSRLFYRMSCLSFNIDNQLCLWSYPSMSKLRELRGHSARVLHLAKSPDGSQVASASADETLRFWDIFQHRNKHRGRLSARGDSLLSALTLR